MTSLDVMNLTSGYADKTVLRGVNLVVNAGEVVALIGHNGAGKSTFLKSVFGLVPVFSGNITVNGINCRGKSPRHLIQLGVNYLPQANVLFTELSVRENLEVAARFLQGDVRSKRIDESLEMFPALKDRQWEQAGNLSGGERQAIALARTMLGPPKLVLLDEPTLGLAPELSNEVFKTIQRMSQSMGIAFLIVEQKVRQVLSMAARVYVLRHGSVSYEGNADSLCDEATLRQVYL